MEAVLTITNIIFGVFGVIGILFIILILLCYWTKGVGDGERLEYASVVGTQFIKLIVKILPIILMLILFYYVFI